MNNKTKKYTKNYLFENMEIIETDPGYRTVNILSNSGDRKYYIWLPYMIYITREYNNKKTLHVGMRTSPLNAENIMEESLLFPPLPNIFACWLLVCSKPSVKEFWNTKFYNHAGWATDKLLLNSGLYSFVNWASMSPKKLVSIFCNWPETIPFMHNGKTGYSSGYDDIMPTKLKVSDCMSPIPSDTINYLNRLK